MARANCDRNQRRSMPATYPAGEQFIAQVGDPRGLRVSDGRRVFQIGDQWGVMALKPKVGGLPAEAEELRHVILTLAFGKAALQNALITRGWPKEDAEVVSDLLGEPLRKIYDAIGDDFEHRSLQRRTRKPSMKRAA
jgi:hypothetical protein